MPGAAVGHATIEQLRRGLPSSANSTCAAAGVARTRCARSRRRRWRCASGPGARSRAAPRSGARAGAPARRRARVDRERAAREHAAWSHRPPPVTTTTRGVVAPAAEVAIQHAGDQGRVRRDSPGSAEVPARRQPVGVQDQQVARRPTDSRTPALAQRRGRRCRCATPCGELPSATIGAGDVADAGEAHDAGSRSTCATATAAPRVGAARACDALERSDAVRRSGIGAERSTATAAARAAASAVAEAVDDQDDACRRALTIAQASPQTRLRRLGHARPRRRASRVRDDVRGAAVHDLREHGGAPPGTRVDRRSVGDGASHRAEPGARRARRRVAVAQARRRRAMPGPLSSASSSTPVAVAVGEAGSRSSPRRHACTRLVASSVDDDRDARPRVVVEAEHRGPARRPRGAPRRPGSAPSTERSTARRLRSVIFHRAIVTRVPSPASDSISNSLHSRCAPPSPRPRPPPVV